MSTTATLPLAADAPKSRKSKLLIIAVAVLVLLAAIGGGAAWWFTQKPASTEAEGSQPAKKVDGKPPIFNTLEAFTVNLAGSDQYMQLGIVLQLKDADTAEKVKTYLPMIRSRILLLLSAKTAEDLGTQKGKQALVEEILTATREPLPADRENVQAVLLGSMLIQ